MGSRLVYKFVVESYFLGPAAAAQLLIQATPKIARWGWAASPKILVFFTLIISGYFVIK